MASGKSYRQKGDLRALDTIDESTYMTPGSSAIYSGTLDTMTPKDSEETEEVFAEGSRAVGAVYRTSASFGWSARFKFALAKGSGEASGWEKWVYRALGTASNSAAVGANQPSSFTAWFKTSSTEEHAYTGSVVEKMVMTASG